MNIERLNRVIEMIRKEPKHFIMSSWIDGSYGIGKEDLANLTCGTAGCIGGWMETLANVDVKSGVYKLPISQWSNNPVQHASAAADWIGISENSDEYAELDSLFMMDRKFEMDVFDRLPPEDRSRAAIRAIEIFRDTGESNWEQALKDTGLFDELRELEAEEDDDDCDCEHCRGY